MRWRDVGKLDCTIARTLSVIGDRWTLLVLRDAFLGIRRFEQLQADLGITRHRLADRLAKLVEHGVLRRERYQERPARFEYRLTEKGLELYGVIVSIADWGDRHMAGRKGPPVERVHRTCGHATTLRLTCEHCGDVVTARDMTARAGPGYAQRSAPAKRSRGQTAGSRRVAVGREAPQAPTPIGARPRSGRAHGGNQGVPSGNPL